MNEQSISNYLFSQGVLGVALLVLGVFFIYYYRNSEKEKKELNKFIFDQLNLRLVDSQTLGKEATRALDDNSQTLRIFGEKIEIAKSVDRNRV